MSQSGLQFKERPNTDSKDTVRLLLYCGGGGGGGCPSTLGATGMVLPFRVPKYITYNRKIVFNNNEFFGIRIFDNAGSDGFCPDSLGQEVSFWMGLSSDDSADIETTAKAGIQLSGALPYEIEFPANLCPQPTEATWENIVYVYIWWGNTLLLNESGQTAAAIVASNGSTTAPLTLIKHDKDSKQ